MSINKAAPVSIPVLTTGEQYSGIQEYRGLGNVKWCCVCDKFKEQLGGKYKVLPGLGRQWVCAEDLK